MFMCKKWIILTLTIMVAAAGVLRFDASRVTETAGNKAISQDSDAFPIHRSPERVLRGLGLWRMILSVERFQCCHLAALGMARQQSLSAISHGAGAGASSGVASLQSLRIKIQV